MAPNTQTQLALATSAAASAELSQQIALDILKQDLATLAWGIAAVVPGVLTLADKLDSLRNFTIWDHFNEMYFASQLFFVVAILWTLIAYWIIARATEKIQGRRLIVLALSQIAQKAGIEGRESLSGVEQIQWDELTEKMNNTSGLTFDKRDFLLWLQLLLLVAGYIPFGLIILGHR